MPSVTRLLCLLTLLALSALPAVSEGAGPVASQLRCDGRENPPGVESSQPLLSWIADSSARGMRQSAWQVLAASEPELLQEGQADLWDSGRVDSNAQRVHYGGRPLRSLEQVFWTVRLWDQTGAASEWSAPAAWTMGFLKPEDWQAKWITGAEAAPGAHRLPCSARPSPWKTNPSGAPW